MNKFKIIVLLTFCFNFTLIADDFAIKADMGTMMFFYILILLTAYQPVGWSVKENLPKKSH